jgi:hypothetical protein
MRYRNLELRELFLSLSGLRLAVGELNPNRPEVSD